MPDLVNLTLPKLSANHLEGDANLILPSYDGLGLVNLAPSVSRWLGGPVFSEATFSPEIMDKFEKRYKRVVVLVVDALGYNHLKRMIEGEQAPVWKALLSKGNLFPISSVSPSTTATALTTIWTGKDPQRHGIIGYEMWVKELSMVINTILHQPITYLNDVGSLVKSGFDPSAFLGVPPFGEVLEAGRIESHSFLPYTITGSGLSQMHSSKTILHGYVSESDLWANLRDNLNARPANAKYIYAYWSLVDTLMHRYGPDDDRVANQFAMLSWALQTQLFDRLESWAKQDTLFLMTADHGAVPTPQHEEYVLANHPELIEQLVMMPTCENRLSFLYVKPGREMAVREYFDHTWPGKFTLMKRQQAFEMNLFGVSPLNPKLESRVGDLIAVSHGNAYLWWANKPNTMLGRHGGLTADEMLIPLFGIDLS